MSGGRRARPASVRSIYLPPWRIDVSRRAASPPLVPATALARLAAAALAAARAPHPASLGLILSHDAELAALNAEHMGQPDPTDVLSFPLLEPSAFARHAGQAAEAPAPAARSFKLPPRRRVHLGDIVVSVERAIAQAADGQGGQTGDVAWSAADELRLLVVHGVLHVCGWDHERREEEAAMRALERRILNSSR